MSHPFLYVEPSYKVGQHKPPCPYPGKNHGEGSMSKASSSAAGGGRFRRRSL
jgi:hypothetical protein